MKKAAIVIAALFVLVIIITMAAAISISFKTIKPTTEAINRDLENYFSKIVYIPQGIPRPIQGFDTTDYFWEMETPQGEITAIRFKYDPSFTKDKNTIQVTLEMPQGEDPSIFHKVLPAVLSDKQSLDSARDPEHANLNASQNTGFEKLSLFIKKETNQTTKIIWDFKKESFGEKTNQEYAKLYKYPPGILKLLYNIPNFLISMVASG